MQTYTQSVNHTTQIITSLAKLSNNLKSAQLYSPKYERHVADNLFTLYREEGWETIEELYKLDSLIDNKSDRQKQLNTITKLIDDHLVVLMDLDISEMIDSGEAWRLGPLFTISSTINMMALQEEKQLQARRKELNNTIYWNNIISFLLIGIAAVTIIITFVTTMRLNRKSKWLEGLLESILNSSKNGIISFAPIASEGRLTDFRIEYANQAIKELLGIKPENLIGKKATHFMKYMSKDTIQEYIDVVEKQEPVEYENFFSYNNINRWVMVRLAPREDGFTATFHDITALKQSEDKLRQSILHLERSNKELEQYAYAASHDLQEPLRKIQTFSNYLWERNERQLDESGKKYLNKILASSQRMSTLIRDILSFSSIRDSAGYVKTDLNREMDNVLQDLELLINQKGARIVKTSLPQLEVIPLQIRQLFYNLVNNALKFTVEDRQPVIHISSRQLTPEEVKTHPQLVENKDYYEIAVKDNGIGFSNDHAGQIFSLFKRLNSKDDFEGSGIGLALCLKVVQNHKGAIYAKGEEGKGAQFFIVLPQKQV
ncbi:MAG: sensor histidine kinase [Chitinophagaceae bacterium]